MNYLKKSFIITYGSKKYRDNYDKIFKNKEKVKIGFVDEENNLIEEIEIEQDKFDELQKEASKEGKTIEEKFIEKLSEDAEVWSG